MDNLQIYNKVRAVPAEAQKPITGGRLSGKTDINPMWRIKALTEQFGPCGIGWYTEITKQWLEMGANEEVAAFVNINLYIKINEEWSKPIPGIGGSMFAALENKAVYEDGKKVGTEKALFVSDECYKMAYTDAISVACKSLGFGADVYWNSDKSKYDKPSNDKPQQENKPTGQNLNAASTHTCTDCNLPISKAENDFSNDKYGRSLCRKCQSTAKKSAGQ